MPKPESTARFVPWLLPVLFGGMVGGVTSGSLVILGGGGSTGSMPLTLARAGVVVHSHETAGNVLAGVYGVAQHRGMPGGGPQGLEGYVYSNPPAGESVRLAMSLIGNGEHAGAGETVEMRSPGGVVSGPGRVKTWWMHRPVVDVTHPEGRIDVIAAYGAVFPKRNVGQRWGMYFDDPAVPHQLSGAVHVGELQFPNGWKLRADGDMLIVLRADGSMATVYR